MTKSKTMLNSRGDSIPTYIVKPYEKQKNRLVNSIHKEAVTLNAKLAAFREKTRDRMLTFCKKCYADAQVKMRGDKGNLTLSSYDNLRKVQISVQNTIAFDERLSIARDLINEYLRSNRGSPRRPTHHRQWSLPQRRPRQPKNRGSTPPAHLQHQSRKVGKSHGHHHGLNRHPIDERIRPDLPAPRQQLPLGIHPTQHRQRIRKSQ